MELFWKLMDKLRSINIQANEELNQAILDLLEWGGQHDKAFDHSKLNSNYAKQWLEYHHKKMEED